MRAFVRSVWAAIGFVAASEAVAEPARWTIDPAHFSIVFSASHAGFGATWGLFLRGEGSFVYDEATRALSDLSVRIDAASVFTNHEARDGHLRSDDFLAAGTHPEITFVMTGAEEITPTTGTVRGDLTVRGVTQPATLDVTLNRLGPYPFGPNTVLGVTARTTVKRSDFGMTYALEGGLVGDEIPVILELEAVRQEGAVTGG